MIKKIIKNILPYGLEKYIMSNYYRIINDFIENPGYTFDNLRKVSENLEYQDKHTGERCFILCLGPTINGQKIELLKNEIVFGVSTGYLHEKYKEINPLYHCQPQLTYTDLYTKDLAIEHFKNMEINTSEDTVFFFNITERRLIEENNLLKNRKVNYVYFGKNMKIVDCNIYSIDKVIPAVSSVPVMCIMLAMYMGFKEIFLLGLDYDHIFTNKPYVHAAKGQFMEKIEKSDKGSIAKHLEQAIAIKSLFYEFRILNKIAKKNNVKIYNATKDGIVDEFERVDFDRLF